MEPGVGREEEENRGKGRSGGEAGREGGTQRRRREEGAWEEGRGLRRGPGGGGDRFVYGQWGEGRGRRAEPGEGGASLPSFPAWDSVVALPSCRVAGSPQLFSSCCLRRPSPTSSRSPGEAGCPFLLLQLADPGRRPVTQSPLRDMGRKRQLLGVGPALPITRRSSPCFFFFFFFCSPWPVFVTVVVWAAARPQSLRQMALGVRSPPRDLLCLPRVPRSIGGETVLFGGSWTG